MKRKIHSNIILLLIFVLMVLVLSGCGSLNGTLDLDFTTVVHDNGTGDFTMKMSTDGIFTKFIDESAQKHDKMFNVTKNAKRYLEDEKDVTELSKTFNNINDLQEINEIVNSQNPIISISKKGGIFKNTYIYEARFPEEFQPQALMGELNEENMGQEEERQTLAANK